MTVFAAPERVYGFFNIRSHIPVVLDLEERNYDAWREFFITHCLRFDVLRHIDSSLLLANGDDVAWKKRDGIVKLWFYGTLSPKQFQASFVTGSTSDYIWLRIENQFKNNIDVRANRLDNELRTKDIGDMKVADYCWGRNSFNSLRPSYPTSPYSNWTPVFWPTPYPLWQPPQPSGYSPQQTSRGQKGYGVLGSRPFPVPHNAQTPGGNRFEATADYAQALIKV